MDYKRENISLIRANTDSQVFDSGSVDFTSSLPFSNLFYPFLLDDGGNYRNISLTIDTLSKFSQENQFPNEKWISTNRLKNNLIQDDIKWGFKETNNIAKNSRAISNAFCFAGQNLSFYISTQGNDSGYVGNTWCYCKTTLAVTVLDILTGTETQLISFSNFSSESDDNSRYFQWIVPVQNDAAFLQYGLFGMFVIKLDITRQIFKDAQMTQILDTDCPNKSQSLLQLLTYSAPAEMINVTSDTIPIITGPINWHSSYNDLFNNSVFASLETLNANDLTDDQKRSIITDQAAVLFMSQHPVVVADYYPSKIIGFGCEQAIRPQYIFDNFMPKGAIKQLETLSADRLYGMIATYKAFNYVDDIQNNFSNFKQSTQKLRDPVKSVIVDKNGILNQEYGINGIQFNPYIIQLNNADIIKGSGRQIEYDIALVPNDIEIDSIQVTEDNGNPFTLDNYSYYQGSGRMLVSFNVLRGEDKINRIRYSIWSKNNLEHYEYVDTTGLTRQYIFTARSNPLNPSLPLGVSYSSSKADIVFVKIDIEDLDGNVNSFNYEKLLPEPVMDSNTKSGITSISVLQRQDGSQLVDIYYDYFGRSTINASNVSSSLSLDGITYSALSSASLRGDVGAGVMPGRNRIIWNPLLTLSSSNIYPMTAYIKLTLSDTDGNSNIGVSNVIGIVNLDAPKVTIRRLSLEEKYPIGVTSYRQIALIDEYSTTGYYYLMHGIVSNSGTYQDGANSYYKIGIMSEYAITSYYYLVNGLFSSTRDYLTPVTLGYMVGIMDDSMNTYYYYLRDGMIMEK